MYIYTPFTNTFNIFNCRSFTFVILYFFIQLIVDFYSAFHSNLF